MNLLFGIWIYFCLHFLYEIWISVWLDLYFLLMRIYLSLNFLQSWDLSFFVLFLPFFIYDRGHVTTDHFHSIFSIDKNLMDIPSVWKLVNSWMVINILSLQIGRTCIIKYFAKNIFKKYLDASEWVKCQNALLQGGILIRFMIQDDGHITITILFWYCQKTDK